MEQLLNMLKFDFENDILAGFYDSWEDFNNIDEYRDAVLEYIQDNYNTEEYEKSYDYSITFVENNGGVRTLLEINAYIKEYLQEYDIDTWNSYDDIKKVVNMFLFSFVDMVDVDYIYEQHKITYMSNIKQV